MFENCKDKNELREEAKIGFSALLDKMDEHVSGLINDTATEEAALVGINATANRIRMLYCGNVFRTEKEAEAHKYEIYEKLTGKKWGGE